MRAVQEEIFGPVLTVMTFTDEADVIERSNDVRYGLAGYVWTNDMKRGHRVAAAVNAGMLWVNAQNVRDLRTPFGGSKQSGIGREGGHYAFEFYTEVQIIHVALNDHPFHNSGKRTGRCTNMPAKTGMQYKQRLKNAKNNVFIHGERVDDPTSHRATKNVVNSMAKLYDLQYEKPDRMLYTSPTSGKPVGMSFLRPESVDDIIKRRTAIQEWAKLSGGMMGRSPDYLNAEVMAMALPMTCSLKTIRCMRKTPATTMNTHGKVT